MWPVLILLLALILRGPGLMSAAWNNAGAVVLSHALGAPKASDTHEVAWADALLRQAIAYNVRNRQAWRGLGFALVLQGREAEGLTAWQISGIKDPIAVVGLGFALRAQGREDKTATVWQASGDMGQFFMALGEHAWNLGKPKLAQWWYEQAVVAEPELADTWYNLALVYTRQGQAEKAIAAYQKATRAKTFQKIGRSSPLCSMGAVYQWLMEPRQVEKALTMYEIGIKMDDFADDMEAANCHYSRGEILWWKNGNPNEYIAEAKRAIQLDPNHVSAHVLLGVAYYIRDQNVVMAETEIRKAIALDPHYRWPYFYLGDVYQKSGRVEEAIAMYKHALAIDPGFDDARQRLQMLLGSK